MGSEVKKLEMPKFHTNYGQWAIDDVYVKVHSDRWAVISYEKYERNAQRYFINIKLWFWENGSTTLEDKVNQAMDNLIRKLEVENILISERKRLSEKLSHRWKN